MTADADLGRVLADIVEAAGREILPLWRSGLQVDRKADESPVTDWTCPMPQAGWSG